MHPTRRCRPAAALLLLFAAPACFAEPFTGSEIVMELGTSPAQAADIANAPDEHYELFFELNGGLVSGGKLRIEPNLDAVSFPEGEPLGVANQLGASLPESGITLRSATNLEDATAVFLSIEANGETDLAPSERIIGRGEVVVGRRSTLRADLAGEVPTLLGPSPLVNSRLTILLTDDDTTF